MKHKGKIGFDVWKADISIEELLDHIHTHELEVYDIQIQMHDIIFYAPIWQRHRIAHVISNITLVQTTGMLGYFIRSLKKPYRMVAVILSCILWFALTNMIFDVEIKGEQKESRQLIRDTLNDMGYEPPFYQNDISNIKIELKKRLENDISWLEAYKQGSRYIITYTPKEFASLNEVGHQELIAQEDGVIVRFDIAHGFKTRKVNDYVHAGDVLVSNVLEDSKGMKEEVYVEGRVYAYTWRDVTVTMDDNRMPKSFQYFDMLMDARAQVSKDFYEGDMIYKENILQFSHEVGKIKMVIHYTLCKDITTP